MKIKALVAATIIGGGISVGTISNTQTVSAASWHKGIPQSLKGSWYHYKNKKPTNRIWAAGGTWAYNDVWYSKHYHAYFNHTSFNFLDGVKYRYIGNHKYIINGISEGGEGIPPIGKRRSHVVKVGKRHIVQYGVKWTRHKPAHMISEMKGMLHP